jgi:hypothetical protein
MTAERELLLFSLPPRDADWPAFEANFLGKRPDCPLTADLIEFAQGESGPDAAARVNQHLAGCDYCKRWVDAYKAGWEEPAEAEEPAAPGGSLLEAFSFGSQERHEPGPAPSPRPAPVAPAKARPEPPDPGGLHSEGLSSVVLTGFFTVLRAGRTQEACAMLRPYLPDILETAGLDPALADRLWQFLLQRLKEQGPHLPPSLFPGLLHDFAREALRFDALPCQPEPSDWQPVLARCALRAVQASPKEPEPVRRFLQAALESGVEAPEGLNLFWMTAAPKRAGISEVECRRLITVVRGEQRRVSRLFGLN